MNELRKVIISLLDVTVNSLTAPNGVPLGPDECRKKLRCRFAFPVSSQSDQMARAEQKPFKVPQLLLQVEGTSLAIHAVRRWRAAWAISAEGREVGGAGTKRG